MGVSTPADAGQKSKREKGEEAMQSMATKVGDSMGHSATQPGQETWARVLPHLEEAV